MKTKIIVATRPSLLAYTQTKQTVALLQEAHPDIEFEVQKFSTQGDRDQRSSLTTFGGTGVFVKELEHALKTKQADIAIHSLKDMPSQQPEGLCLAAFPKREDPRDVLVVANEPIQKIGTGSPRRLLQCALQYPEVSFTEIRGNVGTRLEKMQNGLCDATYLAAAGLNRLGISLPNALPQAVEDFIPAVGQGTLAIQCRSEDTAIREIVAVVSDENTTLAAQAERAFMKQVQGGCKFPLAAHGYRTKDTLRFLAILGDLQTRKFVRKTQDFSLENVAKQAVALAKEMLQECKEQQIHLDF